MQGGDYSARNIRVLLWRQGVDRKKWPEVLAAWSRGNPTRSRELLAGASLRPDEIGKIAQANDLTDGDLVYEDLLEEVDVLAANLTYLLDSLPHGGQRRLAEQLGVDETTVSRWKGERLASGRRTDKRMKDRLERLRDHFGLSRQVDLATDPVFLSMEPVGSYQKLEWLKERIEAMHPTELDELFPALKKLLGPV